MTSGRLPRQPEGTKTRNSSTATIKAQFRQLVKVVTDREPAPAPKRKTRRTEETGRAFRMAARKITPRAVRALIIHAGQYLSDTLDWLNLWSANDDAASTMEADDVFQHTGQDYLSLHL